MPTTPSKIDVAQLAQQKVFLDPENELKLGQLWKNQTAIMVFLRHFACIACRAHASQIWKDRDKFQSGGAKIIFIGNGQPEWIEKFREDLNIEKGVIVTDPSLTSFKLAGFKNGVMDLLQPKSVVNAAKLALEGHAQKIPLPGVGNQLQLGGILAINRKNKVIYHYVSEALGDFPEEPHVEIISEDESESHG